jgi:hypothetical protein
MGVTQKRIRKAGKGLGEGGTSRKKGKKIWRKVEKRRRKRSKERKMEEVKN